MMTAFRNGLYIPVTKWAPEIQKERKKNAATLRAYRRDPKIRKAADKLHAARMLPGRACLDCIEIVISRRKKKC